MSRDALIFLVFVWLGWSVPSLAKVNLALNKSYALSPKPDYRLCTDLHDTVQLTDGRTYGSNWLRKSTVGWGIKTPVPEITIDLEEVSVIDQVRVHTIGGGVANVNLPRFVVVLVSKDGKSFRCAGLTDSARYASRDKRRKEKIPQTLVVGNLKTEARFVKVLLQSGGSFTFLDEIAVMGAPISPDSMSSLHRNLPSFKSTREVLNAVEDQIKLQKDLDRTNGYVGDKSRRVNSNLEKIRTDLGLITERFAQLDGQLLPQEKQVELDEALRVVQARVYREIFDRPYICLPANPMDILEETFFVPDSEPADQITVSLWQREFESAAMNIINCIEEPLTICVSVSDLTGPNTISVDSKKVFTVRRSVFVKAGEVGTIADALVLQNERPFLLKPGEISQIWLTIFDPGLQAGSHNASLKVSASSSTGEDLPTTTIPVNIDVTSIGLPRDIPLKVCNWAYPKLSGVTRGALSETAQDLASHYINVFVISHHDLPLPQAVSPIGRILSARSYKETDELLRANDHARVFLFYWGFRPGRKNGGAFGKWMSRSWKAAFKDWLLEWIQHLKEMGIGYDRFAMYPFDECLGDEFYELAMVMKSIDPNVRIYANSFGKGPSDFMRFKDLVDIWCPRITYCTRHPSWLKAIKAFGKEVWTYDAKGPGKANHPYGYYRLMPWRAFKYELTGVGFWVYVGRYDNILWDDSGKAFTDYGVVYGAAHSPVNTAGEKIIPSRRWEAWREGIEDYIYLRQLEQAARRIRATEPAKADQVQRLLRNKVDMVLANPNDHSLAYEARKLLTDAILALRNEGK